LQLLAEARRLLVHNKIRKDSNRMADSLKRGAVIDDTRHSPEDSIDTKGIHLVDSYNVHVMDNLISAGICNILTLSFPCVILQFQQYELIFQKTISEQWMCQKKYG
jgi:hypothetical protein